MRRTAATIVLAIAASAHAQGSGNEPAAPLRFPAYTRPDPEAGATPVRVGLSVLDIIRIEDVDQTIMVDFFLELAWHDERLALPGDAARGRLRPIDIDDLWHPFVQVANQVRLFPRLPEQVLVDEAGNCVYRQRYVGTLSVSLDLRDFPIDRQTIAIQLVSGIDTQREVAFSFDESATGSAARYTIVDWEVGPPTFEVAPTHLRQDGTALAGFHASFPITRYVSYFALKVITPLVIIIAMSWVVFWIDPAQLGPRVSVGTTSVLTLIAYRFALGNLVPRVSYMTRLDIFILGATILVFVALVEALTTATMSVRGHVDTATRLNWWSRLLFPFSLCLLLALSFL